MKELRGSPECQLSLGQEHASGAITQSLAADSAPRKRKRGVPNRSGRPRCPQSNCQLPARYRQEKFGENWRQLVCQVRLTRMRAATFRPREAFSRPVLMAIRPVDGTFSGIVIACPGLMW